MNRCVNYSPFTLKKQGGIALVELAIAIPALLVMMLITAEITRAMYQYNTLTKLVRDGSRSTVTHVLKGSAFAGLTTSELQSTKRLVISGKPQGGEPLLSGLTEDDITVTISTLGAGGAQRYYVNVAAAYNYIPIFASVGGNGFLPESTRFDFTLTALSSMRAE